MSIDFEEDAGTTPITTAVLQDITKLASIMVVREATVQRAEAALKEAKKDLRNIQERDLPEAMLAANMDKFTTVDGVAIAVKKTLYASIAKANKAEAAQWLINNELGALVKKAVTIHFDAGDGRKVMDAIVLLNEHGLTNHSTDDTMNTTSIKAAIKELLENGVDVPMKLFGAYHLRKATVE